jgi:hypothetical protein
MAHVEHRSIDWTAVERSLDDAFALETPVSYRQLAGALGIDLREMRSHFPDKCELLTRLLSDHRAQSKKERAERLARDVEGIAMSLLENGLHPSRRRVEAMLPDRASLREEALRTAWQQWQKGLRAPHC